MIQFLGLVSIGLMTVTLLLLLFSTTPWVLVTLALAIIISMISLALTSDYQLDHPSEPARDPSLRCRLNQGGVQKILSALLLNLAVDLLRCIWPWLLGLAVLGAGLWLVIWWLRRRTDW